MFISECVKSYGENCQNPCSQHCLNQTCDRFNGKCLFWCEEGFYGEKCDKGRIFFFKVLICIYIFTIVSLLKGQVLVA